MREDQRKGKREKEGKEQKKALKRQMRERWREEEGQRGGTVRLKGTEKGCQGR